MSGWCEVNAFPAGALPLCAGIASAVLTDRQGHAGDFSSHAGRSSRAASPGRVAGWSLGAGQATASTAVFTIAAAQSTSLFPTVSVGLCHSGRLGFKSGLVCPITGTAGKPLSGKTRSSVRNHAAHERPLRTGHALRQSLGASPPPSTTAPGSEGFPGRTGSCPDTLPEGRPVAERARTGASALIDVKTSGRSGRRRPRFQPTRALTARRSVPGRPPGAPRRSAGGAGCPTPRPGRR